VEVLELTEAERTMVIDYSAGMRKKITLATALLHPPRLLVLGWLLGWATGPVAVRGAGQSLRSEWFALVPIPQRRLNPYDASDDPTTAGVLAGRGDLMLLLAALAATPGALVVLASDLRRQPAVEALAVLLGVATGALLTWWGGRRAARRLAERGAEMMDLLAGDPGEVPRQAAAASRPYAGAPRRTPALRGALWTVGIVCVVPQGIVADHVQPAGRGPGGQGLVRGSLPARRAPGPGGGRLHRDRPAGDVVGRREHCHRVGASWWWSRRRHPAMRRLRCCSL
jgi:hypothetical protein